MDFEKNLLKYFLLFIFILTFIKTDVTPEVENDPSGNLFMLNIYMTL